MLLPYAQTEVVEIAFASCKQQDSKDSPLCDAVLRYMCRCVELLSAAWGYA